MFKSFVSYTLFISATMGTAVSAASGVALGGKQEGSPVMTDVADTTVVAEYIKNPPPDLYDQPRIQNSEFHNFTRFKQDELLIQDFLEKKYSPLSKNFYSSLKLAAFFGILPLAKTAHIIYTAHRMESDDAIYSGNPIYFRFNQTFTGSTFRRFGNALFPTSHTMVDKFLAHPTVVAATMFFGGYASLFTAKSISDYRKWKWYHMEDPMLPLEIKYVKKKRFLSPGLQIAIETEFKATRTDEKRIGRAQEFVDTALNIPLENIQIDFNAQKMEKLFTGYDPALRRQVESFIFQQILLQGKTQLVMGEQAPRQGKRIVGFLYGAPGTGKTRYAELIAKALDLPFGKLSLEGASLSDLEGRSIESDHPTPGKIAKVLAKARINGKGAKNMVLFIDEADRVINHQHPHSQDILPFMLKLLDPETKTIFNPYFNTEVDISNLTIILAGNFRIEDEALRKRLYVLEFPGYTTEYKRQIIWDVNLPKMLSDLSQNGRYDITFDDLTEQDRSKIDELIQADHDPGFRTIESVLMHYMAYVARRKHFSPPEDPSDYLHSLIKESNEYLEKKKRQIDRKSKEDDAV